MGEKSEELTKITAQYNALKQKNQEQKPQQAEKGAVASSAIVAKQNQIIKLQEKAIAALEDSHNEQLNLYEHYKKLSDQKMQFSLEVINKSMLAVDLIRRYKEEGGRAGSRHPSKQEVEDVEKIIIECQESMQKNLIPEDDPK